MYNSNNNVSWVQVLIFTWFGFYTYDNNTFLCKISLKIFDGDLINTTYLSVITLTLNLNSKHNCID